MRPDLSKELHHETLTELQHDTLLAPGWPQPHDSYVESSPLPRVFPSSIQLDINLPESRESRENPEYLVKAGCDEKVSAYVHTLNMCPHIPTWCVRILIHVPAYFFSILSSIIFLTESISLAHTLSPFFSFSRRVCQRM